MNGNRATYFICEMRGPEAAILLSETPLDYHKATGAIDKLKEAERVLPESARRKLIMIDLERLLPAPVMAE